MLLKVGSAKTPKFGVSESGDTLELVERRKGGLSIILADGQGSGPAAKRISNLVVSRAIALISEGARDGAVARAVHDVLYALRDGKVSCELTIISVDLHSRSVLISRNTAVPVYVVRHGEVMVCGASAKPIGVGEGVRPSITEFPLEPGLLVAGFTDGILYSGLKRGLGDAAGSALELVSSRLSEDPQQLADALLAMGIERDGGRPDDDMSAVVLGVVEFDGGHKIRKASVSFPV